MRLALSFVGIVLLMLAGSIVALWQFSLVRTQAQRLYEVERQSVAVLRVHTDVLAFRDKLEGPIAARDGRRFAQEAAAFRDTLAVDVERAIEALSKAPSDGERHAPMLKTLEAIHSALPSQIDIMRSLASAGDWDALGLRLTTQVRSYSSLTSPLVEELDRAVSLEEAETLERIERAQRRVFLTLAVTGLLTLLLAGVLGMLVTRSITRPLARLDAGAQALARGEFQHQVAVMGQDELANLGMVFNDMARRLRDLYQALQRSEGHFRSLIENGSDLITVLDGEGRIRYVSPSSERVLGRPPEAFIDVSLFGLTHPHDVPTAKALLAGKLPASAELRLRPGDGSTRVVEAIANNLLEAPAVAGVVINFRDITERKRAEAALRQAEEKYRGIFENAVEGVFQSTREGRFLTANPAMARALGYSSPEELVAATTDIARQIYKHPADRREMLRQLDEHGVVQGFECEMKRKDGSTLWVSVSVRVVRDEAGNVLYFEGTNQDISDRRHAEELKASLRRSETMSAMGSLLAGVAHEVRNPLFGISATLDAFEAHFGQRKEYAETLAVLRAEVDRLVGLMNDLFDFGRPLQQDTVPGSLADVVTQAVATRLTMASRAGVELCNRVPEQLPPVRMDRKRLVQAFENILQNAVQYSPAGGTILIEAAPDDQQETAWLRCTVKDGGAGFATEDLSAVFQPFFTRRRGGTGLGLAIVQRIVEGHGGRVAAANRPEGGAEVTVRLPCAQ